MNATFELVNGPGDSKHTNLSLHSGAIPIGEVYDPGEYVIINVTQGDAGIEGQPETDKRVFTEILMRKAEARAIASAIMGVAAQI